MLHNINKINELLNIEIKKYSNPNLNLIVEFIISNNDISKNIFFNEIINDKINFNRFKKCQEPFFWAVKKWGAIMSDCIYLESDNNIKQIYEKNWKDEFGSLTEKSHVETFLSYLRLIGFNNNNICKKPKCIIDFEQYLDQIINTDTNTRLLVFGTIELIYIYISHIIHNYVSNIMKQELEIHYSLHEILDIEHSLNFLNLVKDINWNIVTNTINIFFNLYESLYIDSTNYIF